MSSHNFKQPILAAAAGSILVGGLVTLLPTTAIARPAGPQLVSQASAISATSAQNETLYLNEDRAYSYNLEVDRGATINGLYIPPGAVIQGQYRPAEDGLRYVTNSVVFNGRSYDLNVTSEVIEEQTDPRDTSTGSIAEDAGIGAAAGAVLGEVTGSIDAGEVLGGAVAGGVVGNVTADSVVVIEPDQPIMLYAQ